MCVSVTSDSLRPHRLQPSRLLSDWDSLGKNNGVGCHFLLEGIFPTQGLNPCLKCLPLFTQQGEPILQTMSYVSHPQSHSYSPNKPRNSTRVWVLILKKKKRGRRIFCFGRQEPPKTPNLRKRIYIYF